MMNTRRFLAVTALSALALGVGACSPKGGQPESGATSSPATPSASASSSAAPSQSGGAGQSGEAAQSASTDRGNQAPDVDVSDNEARCDLSNLQASVGSRQEIGSTTYVEVTFTNEGSSCWISGFPQVLFASGGATVSEAARDGEDPGNVYTIPEGGRVGVTLTAESVDGVDGCTAADADQMDIINTNGSGSTSLRLCHTGNEGGANSDCDEDDWANEVESVSKQNAEYCGDAENDDCFDGHGEPLTCGYCLLVYRLICGLE